MPTAKIWTAHDLLMQRLTITPMPNQVLHVERRYSFLDDQMDVLPDLPIRRFAVDVERQGIPENIQQALLEIDEWTYQVALQREAMAEELKTLYVPLELGEPDE